MKALDGDGGWDTMEGMTTQMIIVVLAGVGLIWLIIVWPIDEDDGTRQRADESEAALTGEEELRAYASCECGETRCPKRGAGSPLELRSSARSWLMERKFAVHEHGSLSCVICRKALEILVR